MRAEAAGDPGPWRQQAILGRRDWDADALGDIARDYVIEHLADDDAVLVIDETGFLKQGKASCGVARQYTGSAGKITNCQIGVFAAYVSPVANTMRSQSKPVIAPPRSPYSLSLRPRARQSGGNNSCSTCASRRCGAAALAGAGVSDLAKLLVAIRGDDGAWAVTDAADGGIADRGGGRGSYRVIAATPAKFCSGHMLPVHLNRCPYARARGRAAAITGDRAARPARAGGGWRCGAATLAGAGVSDLAKLLVAIRGDDGAWAVTDAADGGIADRGGGRGSYRVIDCNAGQILQRAHSTPGFARAGLPL